MNEELARRTVEQMRADADRIEALYSKSAPEQKKQDEQEADEKKFQALMSEINKPRDEKKEEAPDFGY